MCRSHDPLFQASHHSLAYQFSIKVPLTCPPFSIFRKFCLFSLVFGQNCSSQDAKYLNFAPKTPSFSRKSRSLDPTLGNVCSTYLPKHLSAPLGSFHVGQGWNYFLFQFVVKYMCSAKFKAETLAFLLEMQYVVSILNIRSLDWYMLGWIHVSIYSSAQIFRLKWRVKT